VIETGWGSLSLEWWQIQEEISKLTTVVSYDRAGYGESPRSNSPRTSLNIVMELFNMLCNAELKGPYIFIGHSLGGLYVQHFAKLFPRQTAGLILVDSITSKFLDFDKLEATNFQKYGSFYSRVANIKKLLDLDKEEFNKTITPMVLDLYDDFPKLIADQLIIFQSDQSFCKIIVDEYEGLKDSFVAMNSIQTFPDIPLYVLCRDFNVMFQISERIGIPREESRMVEELWINHTQELITLSPKSEFYFIKDSSHNIHLTRPDAIIEVVKKMINQLV
jgi:pimeloyl-ACP methyl ester carboxylesterase